uniref:Uncharacterized GPI-anchored protein At5g19230-like domain-containing protein n=1 Tax=Quercus lobata TaxID=97700 RepID=A0A7N2R0N8_QUELO
MADGHQSAGSKADGTTGPTPKKLKEVNQADGPNRARTVWLTGGIFDIINYSSTPGTKPNVTEYDKLLDGCDIKDNHTVQGVILPVCVPRLDPFLVLSNYTTPQYAKYLKDSNYTGTGIGSEDNWMVVVLYTNTSAGNFSSVASLIANVSLGNSSVALFIGILVVSVVS